MQAWNGWYHVTGNTYGTWLHGDRRGWRTRHGRDHVNGDYKNPPAAGAFEGLEAYSKGAMRGSPIHLSGSNRRTACEQMVAKLTLSGVEVLAMCLGRDHYHVLSRFPDTRVRHWIGLAKKHSSFVLRHSSLAGRVWARGCRPLPIRDRKHQVNVYNYICKHQSRGAYVWTFRGQTPPML